MYSHFTRSDSVLSFDCHHTVLSINFAYCHISTFAFVLYICTFVTAYRNNEGIVFSIVMN